MRKAAVFQPRPVLAGYPACKAARLREGGLAAPLRRARPAIAPVGRQDPPRVALAQDRRPFLERLADLQSLGVLRILEQEVAERRRCLRLEPGRRLEGDLRDEAFRAEHLVHDLADAVQIGVGHLDEDAARRMRQVPRRRQPVAEICEEGMRRPTPACRGRPAPSRACGPCRRRSRGSRRACERRVGSWSRTSPRRVGPCRSPAPARPVPRNRPASSRQRANRRGSTGSSTCRGVRTP